LFNFFNENIKQKVKKVLKSLFEVALFFYQLFHHRTINYKIKTNNMKNFFKKAFLVLCIISIASCSDDDDTIFTPDSMTIADFVANNADYSSLLAALQRTGLDVDLNGNGTFTVFAPNNDAFTEFLDGASLDDVPDATLEQLLRNHVLGTGSLAHRHAVP
jgi:uncharacterized surface protein with fasciclin (FAS1) repeats